jgi:Fic family protein
METTLKVTKSKIKWYSKEVNELLFSQPYVKPKLIGEYLKISSRTTLTKYFNELVENKVLSVRKDGKEVFYVNDDLIKILES